VKWSWSLAVWLAAYLALIAGVVVGMLQMRSQAFAVYGTEEAQAEWDAWRDDAKKMEEQPGVVKRRAPKSAQPPALVLMRDHFGVCLGGGLVLSSVLFGTFMMLVRGAFGRADCVRRRAVGGHSLPYEQ
jgi:hypothetical protein